ncbi:hypothetical protein CHCC20331_0203 [Bacillus paralicheniformis]|nr:hypothetical protein CHCC20372_1046 [Bacillus paralicheniformis]TWK83791.1 hypothetical protein CHCC20331_0203 [Bacillus paralicheniformis]
MYIIFYIYVNLYIKKFIYDTLKIYNLEKKGEYSLCEKTNSIY